jgi:enoyl-[acyl-carrier protein] reductase III
MTLNLKANARSSPAAGAASGAGLRWRWPRGLHIAINYFRQARGGGADRSRDPRSWACARSSSRRNVGREEEVQALVARKRQQLGSVDIFVGNAASGVLKPLSEIDPKRGTGRSTSTRAASFGAQAAVPYMRQQGWGRILTVTSIGSRRVFPEYGVVGVSKAAIEALTRYLAVELAPENIIATASAPASCSPARSISSRAKTR